jgi:hypothetical protein
VRYLTPSLTLSVRLLFSQRLVKRADQYSRARKTPCRFRSGCGEVGEMSQGVHDPGSSSLAVRQAKRRYRKVSRAGGGFLAGWAFSSHLTSSSQASMHSAFCQRVYLDNPVVRAAKSQVPLTSDWACGAAGRKRLAHWEGGNTWRLEVGMSLSTLPHFSLRKSPIQHRPWSGPVLVGLAHPLVAVSKTPHGLGAVAGAVKEVVLRGTGAAREI